MKLEYILPIVLSIIPFLALFSALVILGRLRKKSLEKELLNLQKERIGVTDDN